ncbi:phenylacetate--CoA ligase family protein [Labilibaculum euxinus]|uniref:AMP-binding protein n=1 Tax=Labilibaculum euxinus TaxID=2686357 RepID=A0A7M4DAG1_9BACT|nr:AMP-binding protein [Labilibaculum euxinus]MUP39640.1 AMP-binding protein [Labilibaculum euxinus]MVB08845.1 AMP-binding protein [Labilibaculum euxinus]
MRLYYIFCLLLRYPVFYIRKKTIYNMLKSDWNKETKFHVEFNKRALNNVLNKALKTTYYKNLKEINVLSEDIKLSDFPIVDKTIIRNHVGEFEQTNWFLPRKKMNTGGSTGKPFEFYLSQELEFEFSHQLFFYKRFGYQYGDKIYSFDGIRIDDDKQELNIYWIKRSLIRNFPFGLVRLSATLLNSQNCKFYVEKILIDKPSFLRGYPSALSIISSYILNHSLQKEFDFLKGIMLTSERILETQVDLVRSAFNCPVLPQYGMSEVCAFAFTNPNDLKYYCSPFYGFTEVLDENNSQVNKGEIGEVVVTSFCNTFQPFIRYRTGDLAEFGGVENGFTILNKIFGRSQDYIVDREGKKIMLVGLIFGSHLKAFRKIKTWQIKQSVPGEISVRIDADNGWIVEFEDELKDILCCEAKIEVQIIYNNNFELTDSGKRLFVIQSL